MNHTSAVAKKSFQTAVGERTAIAYFTDAPDECCKLSGEYTSGIGVLGDEGRQQRRAKHQFTTVGAGNCPHWFVNAVKADGTLVSDRDNERSSV